MNDIAKPIRDLYGHMLRQHWTGHALAGPDPGIRWNTRIGRFVKSYLGFLPWSDNVAYLQAQGYWIHDNWLMHEQFGDASFRDVALACSDYVLDLQQPEGYWNYPNREWHGRIATVEGCFAALGLVESYERSGREEYLKSATKWFTYLIEHVKFQGEDGLLAINYFANVPGWMVPNNSTLMLQFLARLSQVSGDKSFLDTASGLVAFLKHVQLPSGELPYAVSDLTGNGRVHFLCYQYNAFEFMDIVTYYRATDDQEVLPILEKLSEYLVGGLTPRGAGRFDCAHTTPEVMYYSLAIAQALSQATTLGLGEYRDQVEQTYRDVLARQQPDGRFAFHSRANYRCLRDRRSYPRYLSMMLHHLLREREGEMQQEETAVTTSSLVHQAD